MSAGGVLRAVAKQANKKVAEGRKALTAVSPAAVMIAGSYSGAAPDPHVWYHATLVLLGSIGVYQMTNAQSPAPPVLDPQSQSDGKETQ